MKAVILAGGYGTRISEETALRPKPMIEVGGKPLLWHIMKIYTSFGITDFVVCLGYRGYVIKEYFINYALHMSDVTIDMRGGTHTVHQLNVEPWTVTLVDTGEGTMTGGRIKRVSQYIADDTFLLTYGDGVSDVDILKLIASHRASGRKATVTAIQPPGRFGALSIENGAVTQFVEKPNGDGAWINGGFFVCEPSVLDYIEDDSTLWEQEPLRRLAQDGELNAYKHFGFWQAMDTLRDKHILEEEWASGRAPWRHW